MSEGIPFDKESPITECPFCGAPLESVYIDIEGQPVLVDEKELTLTPVFITDAGVFFLEEFEDKNMPPFVQHFVAHHMHE